MEHESGRRRLRGELFLIRKGYKECRVWQVIKVHLFRKEAGGIIVPFQDECCDHAFGTTTLSRSVSLASRSRGKKGRCGQE
ncbi:hypothetical protein [Arthrobacter sp. 260]|uniref:hypothetical protein n=1 Tax=Arthrobacter sp. 260 TaxID=2735314 RepID=UPI001E5E6A37|nr:hypothetical protein [Arthrobacter sp. 260]